MRRPKEVHLTVSFIKGLDDPGYYIELCGTDEAGFEVKDEDKPTEKVHTFGHELGHFLCEYFLPGFPSKKRRKCLTIDNEQFLCEKIGKAVKDILGPFIKGYYKDYGSQEKR